MNTPEIASTTTDTSAKVLYADENQKKLGPALGKPRKPNRIGKPSLERLRTILIFGSHQTFTTTVKELPSDEAFTTTITLEHRQLQPLSI